MCVYKVIKLNIDYWGVQTRAEAMVCQELRETYLKLYRLTYCWSDEWFDITRLEATKFECPNSTIQKISASRSLAQTRAKFNAKFRRFVPAPSLAAPQQGSSNRPWKLVSLIRSRL
jgi:Phosphatidylinositol transfer protein